MKSVFFNFRMFYYQSHRSCQATSLPCSSNLYRLLSLANYMLEPCIPYPHIGLHYPYIEPGYTYFGPLYLQFEPTTSNFGPIESHFGPTKC